MVVLNTVVLREDLFVLVMKPQQINALSVMVERVTDVSHRILSPLLLILH